MVGQTIPIPGLVAARSPVAILRPFLEPLRSRRVREPIMLLMSLIETVAYACTWLSQADHAILSGYGSTRASFGARVYGINL